MTDITEISGIGSSKADDLQDAGFETAEDLAAASPSDIAAVEGFGEVRGQNIHEKALDMISVEETEDDEETDYAGPGPGEGREMNTDAEEMFDVDDDSEESADEGPTETEVSFDFDEEHINHLIAGLARVEIQERKRKQYHRVDAIQDLMTQLRSFDGSLTMTDDQMNHLYTAITQLSNDYHGQTGLDTLSGEIYHVRNEISDARDNLMFD